MPYNPQPLEIQNGARHFRTSGNFRRHVADHPKTQNTTGNWAFFTQFPPISEYIQANIEPLGIQKELRIREFPEFPAIFDLAQTGALLDIRNTNGNWLFLAQFRVIFDHLPYNFQPLEIQNIAMGIHFRLPIWRPNSFCNDWLPLLRGVQNDHIRRTNERITLQLGWRPKPTHKANRRKDYAFSDSISMTPKTNT